jgi:hypothetical protein
VNFAFVVMVVAAVSGLVAELALRTFAPTAGPALALGIMALALIGAASRIGVKKDAEKSPTPAPVKVKTGAGQSLQPV